MFTSTNEHTTSDKQTFRSGEVVRLHGKSNESWRDCIILGFFVDEFGKLPKEERTVRVKLARPYAYVSGSETCCPSVLTGTEIFEVEAERLAKMPELERCNPRTRREPSEGHYSTFCT